MPQNTVRLHRVLAAPPEKVYRAFIDPDAMARWLPPDGFTAKVHEMNPVVGGYRMSFTNFTAGHTHSLLEIVQAGTPEAIPLEPCSLGWQQSLTYLARIVEPDIPD